MNLGMPQGLILGPLYYLISSLVFFLIIATMICNFGDDNSLYASGWMDDG